MGGRYIYMQVSACICRNLSVSCCYATAVGILPRYGGFQSGVVQVCECIFMYL